MEEIVGSGLDLFRTLLARTVSLSDALQRTDENASFYAKVFPHWTEQDVVKQLSWELEQTGETLLSELKQVISGSQQLLTLLEQRK